MNEIRNLSIRKFNPGTLQSDEEVIAQFVVRQHELDIVLDVLRGNVDSPSCQHVLVVAPRGRGKTMLLARVAAELRADDELAGLLLPVRFMEESQEIFNLADFWLETLFHLARESVAHDPEFARELRETHAALTGRWREQALEEHARAAVLEAVDRLGKKLVLMIENLQALCENVDDDFGWKLRGVLQSEPKIMLLATATSRFEGLDDATQPFFELFRIIGLQPLTTGECRRLWQVISGDAVSEREIRPLEILTGGNPRLLVIIAGFSQHRSLRQLMEELVKLIDEHTEYFRSHLEVLGKTERRVYVAVIDLWQASNTGEIAARARMDVRIVSTMLGRLVGRGAVIVEGSGKKRLYSAERLYSIYYKLRRERDETAIVENLIRFMAVFYSEAELAEMFGKLHAEADQSKVIHEGIKRTLAQLPQVRDFFSGMAQPGVERPTERFTAIDNEDFERLFKGVNAALDERTFEKVIELTDQFFASQSASSSQVPELLIAWVFFAKAVAYENLGDYVAAIKAYDEVVKQLCASGAPEFQGPVLTASFAKGVAQGHLGDPQALIATCDEVIELFGASDVPEIRVAVATTLLNRAFLRGHLGDYEEVIATCDEVIERFGTNDASEIRLVIATAWLCKGIAQTRLGAYKAENAAYDEVVERFSASDVPEIRHVVAIALSERGMSHALIGRAGAALRLCEALERHAALTGDEKVWFEWRATGIRAMALVVQEKHHAAMDAFRSAYDFFNTGDETMMDEMLRLVPDLIVAGASEHDLVEILSSDKAKSDALLPLVVALRQRIGEKVRAPAEVLEVAADIHKRIEEKRPR